MVTVGNTWHIITPSHSGFGVMRWSSVISTRVLQALSQPEPSQSHWSGAEAGTAIWSSPSTLGMLRGKKKEKTPWSCRTGLKPNIRAGKWTQMPHASEAVSFREWPAVTRKELVTDKTAKRAVLVHILKSAFSGLRLKM
ncbi:hypothetical protein Q7C36_011265 [Tachysurus vachellii]|uniref:Uncharacterized protein n=1 Tax=Tachysurus vachellii TaxID=175792 RepID=A0AA88MQG2_TACVA|nr:hypothetical protein Q7C36_011265 [Tachysurus vachellii]